MTERRVGRPWTDEEDHLLTKAVALHGEHDNWKIIASTIPGRSNKACRKRWLHSLSPSVKKSAWTGEEDQLLRSLYSKHGAKWSTIARQIIGRTDDACSKRFREALDPSLKKDEWTLDEDAKLLEVYEQVGKRWGRVGQELGRSGLACRNRWRLLERKKAAGLRALGREPSLTRLNGTDRPPLHGASSPMHPELLFSTPTVFPSISMPQQSSCHHRSPESYIPPYYPPEAYLISCPDENSPVNVNRFRETTPEPIVALSPHIAPFQFTSSSLSAALSNSPPLPRPLPTVLNQFESPVNRDRNPILSPLPLQNVVEITDSEPMPMDDVHLGPDEAQSAPLIVQPTNLHASPHPVILETSRDMISSVSPIVSSIEEFPVVSLPCDTNWASSVHPEFSRSSIFGQSPIRGFSPISPSSDGHSDLPSTSSTPFTLTASISSSSSPSILSPDLPSTSLTTKSLLFSSQTLSPSTLSRKLKPRRPRIAVKPHGSTRLSNVLALSSNSSACPYACGRSSCWPPDAVTSLHKFKTSGELLAHSKAHHANETDSAGIKPFRCGLPGCPKSWKSINGLQYHLQVCKEHFQTALSHHLVQSSIVDQSRLPSPAANVRAEVDAGEKIYACTRPQCLKVYRQSSGLRYHLKHGHPEQMPVQISEIPPVLARQAQALRII